MCRHFGIGITLYRGAAGIQVVIVSIGDQRRAPWGFLRMPRVNFPLSLWISKGISGP